MRRIVGTGPFAYRRPATIAEAVGLPASLGSEALPLAGGHSLIPMMKLRLAVPEHLVDLQGVGDLRGIRRDGDRVVIGAMTTQHELLASALIAASLPILQEAALLIADPQVRFVVVSTQGKGDAAALTAALAVPAELRSFVGSRRKIAALRARLAAEGVAKDALDGVKAPAGLDIGAITPEEIALAILGEITRHRRHGQRLAAAPSQGYAAQGLDSTPYWA